jgi:Flp pilus assembly pilin Flp
VGKIEVDLRIPCRLISASQRLVTKGHDLSFFEGTYLLCDIPSVIRILEELSPMSSLFRSLLFNDEGQDIAEYAVMVAVILVIVVGTIRLVGTHSNTVFSNVASSIQ